MKTFEYWSIYLISFWKLCHERYCLLFCWDSLKFFPISIEYTLSDFTDHMIQFIVRYWMAAAATKHRYRRKVCERGRETQEKRRWKKSLVCKSLLFFSSSARNVCINPFCCLRFFHASLLKTVPVEFGFIEFIAALQEIDIETGVYVIDFHRNTHLDTHSSRSSSIIIVKKVNERRLLILCVL